VRFRRRRSHLGSRAARELDNTRPLKGQVWTRSERALKDPDVHWARRAMAVAVAAAEAALLAWLLFGPALGISTVRVTGQQHLTATQVKSTAGIVEGRSVLWVDGQQDQTLLLGLTWVRTASVTPQLTGIVAVTLSEWQPVAAFHAGAKGKLVFLSNQAAVLGPASSAGTLVSVQGPEGPDPKAGDRPLDQVLLTALVNIQKGLPNLIGQQVASFIFDSCGNLTMIARVGWKVYFGRVLTPEEYATLKDKLAALKAINGKVDYNSTNLEYVNVMNPATPAVKYKSDTPPAPSPSPGRSPAPSPSPSPACK
jgi:POTRA domain, FtsQ-type